MKLIENKSNKKNEQLSDVIKNIDKKENKIIHNTQKGYYFIELYTNEYIIW